MFVFTFTARPRDPNGGPTIAVPAGFSAPVTTMRRLHDGQYRDALADERPDDHAVQPDAGGECDATITYGATSGGSCGSNGGVTASSTVGNYTFTTQEKSTSGGTLTNLAASPTGKVM